MNQTTVGSNKNQDISVKIVATDFHYEKEKDLVFPPEGVEYHHSVKDEGNFIVALVESGILSQDILTKADGTKVKIPNGSKQVAENRRNAAKSERMVHNRRGTISIEEAR